MNKKIMNEKVRNGIMAKAANWIADHPWKSTWIMFVLIILTLIAAIMDRSAFHIFAVILSIFSFLIALAWFMRGLKRLFNNKGDIYELIFGYALAVIGIIFFFSIIYSIADQLNIGYLTYDECHENPVELSSPGDGKVISLGGKIYFSAVTFFTIGYGDICPMGINKWISIINGFFGSVFATIILAIAISKYLEHDRK